MAFESTTPPGSASPSSPLKQNWSAVVFLLALLLAAGITATVVGYRVKKADWDRKRQLLTTYQLLGGSFETSVSPSQTILGGELTAEQRIFASVYEVNQRVRDYGLLAVINSSARENVELAASSMAQIGATEASRTIEDTLKALNEAARGAEHAENKEALRRARQYGRPMTRDTEAKLFKYLDQNRQQIIPQIAPEVIPTQAP